MTAKSINLRKFKEDSGLNDATISRLRLKQTTVTMRVGIAVCFGLNIDITEAGKLLELARLTLNNDDECLAYEFVIANFKDCPLFRKKRYIREIRDQPNRDALNRRINIENQRGGIMAARGKSINLFLMDGTATGRMMCTLANWTGVAYKIPRTDLDKCREREDLSQSGVYFLFGNQSKPMKLSFMLGRSVRAKTVRASSTVCRSTSATRTKIIGQKRWYLQPPTTPLAPQRSAIWRTAFVRWRPPQIPSGM